MAHKGARLQGVAGQFHLTRYSSVSSVIERRKALVARDLRQKVRAEKLISQLGRVKSRLDPFSISLYSENQAINDHRHVFGSSPVPFWSVPEAYSE